MILTWKISIYIIKTRCLVNNIMTFKEFIKFYEDTGATAKSLAPPGNNIDNSASIGINDAGGIRSKYVASGPSKNKKRICVKKIYG